MRWLIIFVLLASPLAVRAADVTVTIPAAFIALDGGKDTELCNYLIEIKQHDGGMTTKQCLEEVVRDALLELAIEKKAKDLRATTRAQQRTESDAITASWPSGVDPDICGDNELDGTEVCDGTDDAACPGVCEEDCTCP